MQSIPGHLRRCRRLQIRSSALHRRPTALECPTKCCNQRTTWTDQAAYRLTAKRLAGLFRDNFAKFADKASAEIRSAAPK